MRKKVILKYFIYLSMLPCFGFASESAKSLFSIKNVEVVSVSRKPEKAFEAASAIYVLTNEDIKRSGAINIPEALRLVPGLEVARIDSNKWAITSRGFNRQYVNKLLVMIDGRTVYTPLFSGIYWDAKDTMLEDIDRIEVIRGPGASVWGANAVNGVINIITKDARLTQGPLVSTSYGTEDRGSFATRFGGKIENNIYYRVYGKYSNRDSFDKLNGDSANNELEQTRVGFRVDWQKTARDLVTVQGDLYNGYNEYPLVLPGISTLVLGDETNSGGNILSKWKKFVSSKSDIDLQVYLDYSERNFAVLKQERLTFDIDFQNTLTGWNRNEITWGLGYRFFKDDIESGTIQGNTYLDYNPDESYNNLYSAFLQDKITLSEDKLFLILGSKFEHNYYTGFNVQPNARISWLPTDKQSVWASISRAVRTPSRGEIGITQVIGGSSPNFVVATGNDEFKAEELTAYEIGYRFLPVDNFSIDTTAFFNDYDSLRSFEPISSTNFPIGNKIYGETYGFEISADWRGAKNWTLSSGYSFLTINLHKEAGSTDGLTEADEEKSPKHQFKLSSRLNLTKDINFDNTLYYVSSLGALNIDEYVRFDTSISWKPKDNLEISLVGQNLFDDTHQEFSPALYSTANEIGRSFYGKVTYKF